jgi:hypothetical protein
MTFENAVASEFVMPNVALRPPSPATPPLMPISPVPGSPFTIQKMPSSCPPTGVPSPAVSE